MMRLAAARRAHRLLLLPSPPSTGSSAVVASAVGGWASAASTPQPRCGGRLARPLSSSIDRPLGSAPRRPAHRVRYSTLEAAGGEGDPERRRRSPYVRIGDASRPLGPPPSASSAHLVPRGYLPPRPSQTLLEHLRWMLAKDSLAQDVLLVGPPGSGSAYRRRLAMAYGELTRREVEVLTLSGDVTEGDLKQRRELVGVGDGGGGGGARVEFVDQPPVRAALGGRLLVLDGLERAERNVLPALNNLLENREMHLEDGRLLVSPRRFEELTSGASSGAAPPPPSVLVPVRDDFRVVALGVPCPPYEGGALDPPLRSRFQIRRVDNPTPEELYSDLLASGRVGEAEAALCAKFAGTMEAAATPAASSSSPSDFSPGGGNGGGGGGRRALTFPSSALPSAASVLSTFPDEDPGAVLLRSYPAGSDDGRLAAALSGPRWEASRAAFGRACEGLGVAVPVDEAGGGGEGGRRGGASSYEISDVRRAEGDGEGGVAEVTFSSIRRPTASAWDALLSSSDGAPSSEVSVRVPCGPRRVHPASPDFVRTVGSKSVLSAMVQEHSAGRHVLLLGPKGEGKSASAAEFASMLGYDLDLLAAYRDMTGRDLLMRRATDAATGGTGWEESPLVRAARLGRVCVLDGIEKLGGDALATLGGLLMDGEAGLPDGRKLARADRLRGANGDGEGEGGDRRRPPPSSGAAAAVPIHPSFRVVALASVSGESAPSWLTEDVMSMFGAVAVPPPSRDCLRSILTSRHPSCPDAVVDRALTLHGMLAAGDAAADCGVAPLSARNLLRIARRMSGDCPGSERLHDVVCSVLVADLLPPAQRSALESLLRRAKIAKKGARKRNGKDDGGPELRVSVRDDSLSIGEFSMERARARRPEMVPSPVFFDIPSHVHAMRDLLSEWNGGERAFLLLGNQGVGKNKIVDRICELANFEREYMQLHRDSTVGQLTLSPSLEDGRIVWKDSPLVRAVTEGCALVIDEADKAPVEVISVLKGLVEDGELLLADGRRISRNGSGNGIIPVHPDFTVWVLANRPGYPFHGNDFFREVGDCFSTRVIPNPDLQSEINLLQSYAPSVDASTLRQIAASFADLRMLSDHGDISYPYSTREAVSVVKHLEMYPDDSIVSILHNVLDIDSFDERLYAQIGKVFQRHGIPVTDYPSWREALVRARSISGDGRDGELSIEYPGGRSAEDTSSSPPPLSVPKRGKWDENNEAHVGGNQWAGGTGGSDTAGLGGRGGPYRLDRGHRVHQVSDAAKAEVSEEAAAAAREMAQTALEERLAEIGMSETEWRRYDGFVEPIRGDVANLRGTLSSAESRRSERGWIRRQSHGEIDDSKLVDGAAGDKYIYKRRGVIEPRAGRPLQCPKRLRFVLDISGSMYRFNGYDERLNRCLEAAALIMESFEGMENRFEYSIVGHSGDSSCIPLVEFGRPPANAKERMRVLQSMIAHTQYCQSGDNTLEAMARAIVDVSDNGNGAEADEHIVIGVSDANLARYGIHPRELGKIMEEGANNSDKPVKAYCIFIASLGREAEDIKRSLPVGKSFVCMNTSELPRAVRNILAAQVR